MSAIWVYGAGGKEVIALGIKFSSAEKEVPEWEALPYESLLIEGQCWNLEFRTRC